MPSLPRSIFCMVTMQGVSVARTRREGTGQLGVAIAWPVDDVPRKHLVGLVGPLLKACHHDSLAMDVAAAAVAATSGALGE